MLIVGKVDVFFTDKSGRDVRGTRIYGTQPLEEGRGEGLEAVTEFISEQRLRESGVRLEVGAEVKLIYNKKGRLVEVAAVDSLGGVLEV